MPIVREGLTWRTVEMHLKQGARAFKASWPEGMWVEMCIDNACQFVIHRDGSYERWSPRLEDFAERAWTVSKV